jgi:putative flippase GtrA
MTQVPATARPGAPLPDALSPPRERLQTVNGTPVAEQAPAAERTPAAEQAPAAEAEGTPAAERAATAQAPRAAERSQAAGGVIHRLRGAIDVLYREMIKFGAVGAVAYLVDVAVFNLLRTGLWAFEPGPLAGKPLTAKVISAGTATVVAWLGNRYWTFRHRRRASRPREFAMFALMNIVGLAIAVGCLAVSHYLLGMTSALADNVSGNIIGLGLGTLFRFYAYRTWVFSEPPEDDRPAGEASVSPVASPVPERP